MLLTANFLLVRLTTNSMKFNDRLIRNVFLWTMSELVMDLVYFVGCVILFKKIYFNKTIRLAPHLTFINWMFKNWVMKMYPLLVIGVIGVATLGFYVLFFVVLRVSAPL
jgi:hypothetical protein